MRNVLISLAAAASALAFAAPAAAQYYPAPPPPYGNAYGYNNYGHIRSLQARVDNLQRQIVNFDRRNIISDREARRLRDDTRDLERRLRRDSRDGRGLNRQEMSQIEYRLARLEQKLRIDARDGHGWGRRDGRNYGFYDRDRDGRDDRWEDDRGRDHD